MVYQSGLYFSNKLGTNLDDLIKRVDNGKASLIIIDGGIGEGKTTLAVEVADYINSKKGLPVIDITAGDQIAMGGKDFLGKLRTCFEKKYPVIIYDEAGDFSRRSSLTQSNNMLNRTFETFRAFKVIVIIVLPSFNMLDKNLFDNNIPRLLLHLKGRTQNTGYFYGYSLNSMNWIRVYMEKYKTNKNYAFTRVSPNFNGHFQNLDLERSKELDKASTKNKKDILKESEIRIEGLYNYTMLSSKLYKSISWIKGAVSSLKIKHTKIIRQAKYFDENTLNRLAEYIDEKDNRLFKREE